MSVLHAGVQSQFQNTTRGSPGASLFSAVVIDHLVYLFYSCQKVSFKYDPQLKSYDVWRGGRFD